MPKDALGHGSNPHGGAAHQAGVGTIGIHAFHGSPYSFAAFDRSRMGTGEGNQAFGRGLYFAEREDVARSYIPEGGGFLYDVDIDANPDHFLDWDRSFDEQSPHVKDALGANPELLDAAKDEAYNRSLGATSRSRQDELYAMIKNPRSAPMSFAFERAAKKDPDKVANDLSAKGIVGIKYYDQRSRTGREGTHNYVVFDDRKVKIRGKR